MKRRYTIMIVACLLVTGAACLPLTQIVLAQQPSAMIPEWIKQNAGWWADGSVDDATFLNAIQYLTQNRIINVPPESGVPGYHDTIITIGFIPVEKADELTPKAQALEEFLEQELGMDVEIMVPTDYESILEGMRFGHIDAAFMDTGPAWINHQRTGAEVVLAEVVNGKVNYQATVWAPINDKSVQSIEDTVGKKVAFTSITGSSGFVRPMGTLVANGHVQVDGDDIIALHSALADNFESYTFTGGYKAALQLVLNGKADVAFGSDIAPQKYLEPEQQAKLRAAVTIGPVPSHVFMVSAEMPGPVRDALVDAMVKLNYDQNNHILADLYGADALLPTTTTMHIGDFGTYINSLTGLDQLILDKHNKNK